MTYTKYLFMTSFLLYIFYLYVLNRIVEASYILFTHNIEEIFGHVLVFCLALCSLLYILNFTE